jgi:hypothetical protein
MLSHHITHPVKVRLAALSAVVACIAGVAAPTASALNPQPLPPGHLIPRCATGPCR